MYAPPGENPGLTPGAIVNPQPFGERPMLGQGGGHINIAQLLQLLQQMHGQGGQFNLQQHRFPAEHGFGGPLGEGPPPAGRQYDLTDIIRSAVGQSGANLPHPPLANGGGPGGPMLPARGFSQREIGPMQGLLRAHGLVNVLQRLRLLRPHPGFQTPGEARAQIAKFPSPHVVDAGPGAAAGSYSHGPVY